MKQFLSICLALLLLAACGGNAPLPSQGDPSSNGLAVSRQPEPSSQSGPPDQSLAASQPSEASSSSPVSDPDPVEDPPDPSSSPLAPRALIGPPSVPHGAELDGVDFSAMDKKELIPLLEQVLDRAAFFCQFGRVWYPHTTNLVTDEDFAASILWLYDQMSVDFHPFLGLPYQTVEELGQDMLTVFTPDNLDQDLKFIFEGLTDHEGKLYYVGIINGYLPDRQWDLEQLEIISAKKDKLTVTMPVSWSDTLSTGWGDAQSFTAPLNFEIRDGYILVDSSYFAKPAS